MNLLYRWFLPLRTSTLSNKSVLVTLHTFRCSPMSGVVKFPCKYTRHKTVAKYFVEGEWLRSIWDNEVGESHIIECGDRTAHCDIFKLRRVRFFPFWRHELQISYRASQYALLSVPMCSYTCQVEKAVLWLAQSAWSRELWTCLKQQLGSSFYLQGVEVPCSFGCVYQGGEYSKIQVTCCHCASCGWLLHYCPCKLSMSSPFELELFRFSLAADSNLYCLIPVAMAGRLGAQRLSEFTNFCTMTSLKLFLLCFQVFHEISNPI